LFAPLAGVFCVAAGLYFAAEWLEDHTKSSQKLIKRYTIFCVVTHLSWLVSDSTALIPNLAGLASDINSWLLLKQHPNHQLDGPCTIIAAVLLVGHQISWLMWWNGTIGGRTHDVSLLHVISILAAIVWPVPVMLLLSSASNESLPVAMPVGGGGHTSSMTLSGSPRSSRGGDSSSSEHHGLLSLRRGSASGAAAAAGSRTSSYGGSSAPAAGSHSKHRSRVLQGFEAVKQLVQRHQLLPITDHDAEVPAGLMAKVFKD
jgi:hypothetical protein